MPSQKQPGRTNLDNDHTKLRFRQAELTDAPIFYAIECSHNYPTWTLSAFENALQAEQIAVALDLLTPPAKSNFTETTLTAKTETLFEQLTVGFGIIRVVRHTAELLNLGINPHFQGQGFGSILLGYLFDLAQLYSCIDMKLEVRESNIIAQNFYHSLGFETIGFRPAYYQHITENRREHALVMRKVFSYKNQAH